jgi:hypothetical protein
MIEGSLLERTDQSLSIECDRQRMDVTFDRILDEGIRVKLSQRAMSTHTVPCRAVSSSLLNVVSSVLSFQTVSNHTLPTHTHIHIHLYICSVVSTVSNPYPSTHTYTHTHIYIYLLMGTNGDRPDAREKPSNWRFSSSLVYALWITCSTVSIRAFLPTVKLAQVLMTSA